MAALNRLAGWRVARCVAATGFAFLLAACGGGGNGAMPPPGPEPAGIYFLAGSIGGPGFFDAPNGVRARFNSPSGVAVDADGVVYVADNGNQAIRRIDRNGAVTTLVAPADGVAPIPSPTRLAFDRAGVLHVIGGCAIYKVSASGAVSRLQTDQPVFTPPPAGGDCATIPGTLTIDPSGLAFDAAGNLYVSDARANLVRKVSATGQVSVLAGSGQPGRSDGLGAAATLYQPAGLAIDPAGTLSIAEAGGTATLGSIGFWSLRTVTAQGEVRRFGPGDRFQQPRGVARDASGNLYVADTGNCIIRRVSPAGDATDLAGVQSNCRYNDGTGEQASFFFPSDIALDPDGNLIVADTGNHAIRKVTPAGVVTTLAGGPADDLHGSRDGAGGQALFSMPRDIAADPQGNLYISDDLRIRKVTPGGTVSSLVTYTPGSTRRDGTLTQAQFGRIGSLAADRQGNLFVGDNTPSAPGALLRRISADGQVSTLAGNAGESGSVDGVGAQARFRSIGALAVHPSGDVFVIDAGNALRRVTPQGSVTTVVSGLFSVNHVAIDGPGNVHVSGPAGVYKLVPDGKLDLLPGSSPALVDASGPGLAYERYIAFSPAGELWISENWASVVRKLTPGGVATTVVGRPFTRAVEAGALPGALDAPSGLVFLDARSFALVTRAGVVRVVLP